MPPYNAPMLAAMNLLGAATGLAYNLTCMLVFLLRLVGRTGAGRAVGFCQAAFLAPLFILVVTAPGLARAPLYYVQAILLLLFVAFELVVDTILRVGFRSVRWALVTYVVFFFAATGGMLGVVSLAGQGWMLAGIATFLGMAGLAFAQSAAVGEWK